MSHIIKCWRIFHLGLQKFVAPLLQNLCHFFGKNGAKNPLTLLYEKFTPVTTIACRSWNLKEVTAL